MNDDSLYGWVIGIGMILVILFGIGYGIVEVILGSFFPPAPPSAEQLWVQRQSQRCDAMGGKLDYANGEANCYRTPFMRHPKHLFKERMK